MSVVKRIVCLANSYKHSGRCVAGKEHGVPGGGAWIRPVSSRQGQEVSEHERQYENGADPRLLDIVDVPLLAARATTFQSENWLLDPEQYWVKQGRLDWLDLALLVDAPPTLWTNGRKTFHGKNDFVPAAEADLLQCSLYLIRVARLDVSVFIQDAAFGGNRRKVQGNFEHHNIEYGLSITDPPMKRRFLEMGLGHYSLGECCLTISLGERHTDDRCYKLIAAVMERP